MVGRREGVIKWTDHGFYPVEEKLGKDLRADKEAVLLVDIGGGLGHDLEDFRAGYPHLPGRLVLEDLSAVTKEVNQIDKEIEVISYDFFMPQPIKGKSINNFQINPEFSIEISQEQKHIIFIAYFTTGRTSRLGKF